MTAMSSNKTDRATWRFDLGHEAHNNNNNISPRSTPQYTTTLTLTLKEVDPTYILNDANVFILRLVFNVCISILYGLFGMSTNVINIFIFIKQGLFSGGSTLNLFFLAIGDLGVSFTLALYGMANAIIVGEVHGLPVAPSAVIFFAFAWPLAMFTLVNRMVTAYVAFERCMCVVIPFRVKNVFSPRKNLIYLIVLLTYSIFSHTPIYIVHYLGHVALEGTENRTQLDLVFGPNREFWHDLVYYGNYLVLSVFTAVIVMVCTVITSAYVRTSREWRIKASSAADGERFSTKKNDKNPSKSAIINKEARLVKMIVTISVIFCVCYIPEVIMLVTRSVEPRLDSRRQFKELAHLIYTIKFHAAAVNSSINIFVYYRMSSKYRQIFLTYFSSGAKDKN